MRMEGYIPDGIPWGGWGRGGDQRRARTYHIHRNQRGNAPAGARALSGAAEGDVIFGGVDFWVVYSFRSSLGSAS
jgi:hypothetical protein